MGRRIAIKVDCDTFEGTKVGVPNLLRLFDRMKIRASFFFTLGPDRSGRAVRRLFIQKGFLKKMLRTNAVSLYGPKTMLYGTLLPAPMIGRPLASVLQSVKSAGHEVGIHGWDHVDWHDYLHKMSPEKIKRHCDQAHEVFESIFGTHAQSMAAPGWHSTPAFLKIQDGYNLLYSSNTRVGAPHFPSFSGTRFKTLEIPTTLPTWDEALSLKELQDSSNLIDYYRKSVCGTDVHTIHTEVEGMSYLGLFEKQLDAWRSDGVSFFSLEDYAKEMSLNRPDIPVRELVRVEIPNRAGFVSSSRSIEAVAS